MIRKSKDALRHIESYAQDILKNNVFTPRKLDIRVVLLQSPTIRTWLLVPFFVFVIAYHEYLYFSEHLSRDGFYYFIVISSIFIAIKILMYDALRRIYLYIHALKYGKYTTARIVSIERKKPRRAPFIEGKWEINGGDAITETRFRLDDLDHGSWIWDLEPGSEVHTILNSDASKVLLVIGRITEESPRIDKDCVFIPERKTSLE